jgi:gliding motility-associated-like protein
MKFTLFAIWLLLWFIPININGQEIELYQQFNGRYDYLAFGNTLNISENTGTEGQCDFLTETSALFELQADQSLIAAFLYWAGSGEGDFSVTLNGITINSERNFNYQLDGNHFYFGGFADVTSLLAATGNGTYTLTDLTPDISPDIYCSTPGNTTNFAGWAITVIYEDNDLTLNQVNVFDGFEAVSQLNNTLNIELNNLNVLDNLGAKIGFTAWEGDLSLAVNETLRVNGNIISNPPLNPEENAFNGTNSFTGASNFYNMDLDFYTIENNIQAGDESALVQLTSGQDLVIINNVITVLNTELPDATISIDNFIGSTECGDRELALDYTVYNINSTAVLADGVSIGFYADNTLLGSAQTTVTLPIDAFESGSITLTVPESVGSDFLLRAFVDNTSSVNELNENNNEDTLEVHIQVIPNVEGLVNDLELCDVFGIEYFDLTSATSQIDPLNEIVYYLTEEDALQEQNAIEGPENFLNTENPQTIWVRVFNEDCFVITHFEVENIICPLPDATVSINNDIYACRQRDLTLEFTVYNTDGTATLPSGTFIAFYANLQLIGMAQTVTNIPSGGSESGSLEINLPESIPEEFTLLAIVDDDGTGIGSVEELNEFNNEFELSVQFGNLPPIPPLPDLTECDTGLERAVFNLLEENFLEIITSNSSGDIQFFFSQEDAILNTNPIANPGEFENTSNPQSLYIRLENEICFTTASFQLVVEKCPPIIPQGISPNGDGLNDVFKIEYIVDVFPDFVLSIYSREGNLIYEGGNDDGLWDAIPNLGILQQNKLVPVGTYYYVLVLNDPDFPEPFIGFVYVNY